MTHEQDLLIANTLSKTAALGILAHLYTTITLYHFRLLSFCLLGVLEHLQFS